MQKYAVIEKAVGETPLEALESFRQEQPELKGVPLTYAGRLDPMASGKLIILCGEECQDRSAYDALDKEYEFEVLFGCATDTGDVLGLPQAVPETQRYSAKKLISMCTALRGVHTVPYPAFSSKTVSGIPLFEYALKNTLHTIEIPTTEMNLYAIRYESIRTISGTVLLERILSKIVLLRSNEFRSDMIGKKWSELLGNNDKQYAIAKFRAVVSSGSYIRTLASMIAREAGTDGIAYSIHRSKVGKYQPLFLGKGFWKKVL
ncbi:MAG: truB [Candidatus Kaiserbacteria bacterium]|nr:truB [Candidatus Kaiserbacteria bacterium]